MKCERCGAEQAIGVSIESEMIGEDCLGWYADHPEAVRRVTDAAENDALRCYLLARR